MRWVENVANVGHWSRTAAIKIYMLYWTFSFVDILSSMYFRFRSLKHNYYIRQFLGHAQGFARCAPPFYFRLICFDRNHRRISGHDRKREWPESWNRKSGRPEKGRAGTTGKAGTTKMTVVVSALVYSSMCILLSLCHLIPVINSPPVLPTTVSQLIRR
jgi:hypothetical protein